MRSRLTLSGLLAITGVALSALMISIWLAADNCPAHSNNASNANNGFDITAPYTAELALAADAAALVKRLALLLCAGQLSAANQMLIINALNATPVTAASPDSAKRDRIGAAVLMVMASSDYLIQK